MSAELKRKEMCDTNNESTAAATTSTTTTTANVEQQQLKKSKAQIRPAKSAILGKDGEWWCLSNNRYVRISEFKGKKYVDIREYYVDDSGELKPGKKGISLSPEQFKEFASLFSEIQSAL